MESLDVAKGLDSPRRAVALEVYRHAHVTRAVIDRDRIIPDHMVIGARADADARRSHRTGCGVTLVTRDMLRKLA